ncbi:hypothetical protein ACTSKR_00810 [Chitinibacteraceae bacterium HSL-7]
MKAMHTLIAAAALITFGAGSAMAADAKVEPTKVPAKPAAVKHDAKAAAKVTPTPAPVKK